MPTLSGPSRPPLAGGAPRQLVLLLHGLGADGSDLIELAPMLGQHLPHAAFIAPDAPEPCDMGDYGRQWFSLQDRRPQAMARGVLRAAPVLDELIDLLLERHRLEDRQLARVGFSQGTMMALHTAPRRQRALGAVLGFSGALLGPERLPAETRSRPPVMLVHGDADEVVPVDAMFMALDGLGAAGIPTQWLLRPGLPHSIDPLGIAAGGRFLRDALGA